MKPYDLIVALRLLLADEAARARPTTWLASELGLSTSRIHESLGRLHRVRIVDSSGNRVSAPVLTEFLEHGLRFVFPAELGSVVRGVPTATSAEPLASVFVDPGDAASGFVWPSSSGKVRGVSIVPLHKLVPSIAEHDERMHELLALVDGLRLDDPRVRREAAAAFRERVTTNAA
ncbi:MAG: hypothetical protein H7287_00410 [Thermoleophilia bacterium]|nr:hypothetical protein [Thermoleophilia bacterium]